MRLRDLANDLARLEQITGLPNNEISFGFTSGVFRLLVSTCKSANSPLNLILDTSVKFMVPLIIYELDQNLQSHELLKIDEHLLFYLTSGSGVGISWELGTSGKSVKQYDNRKFVFALIYGGGVGDTWTHAAY